MAAQRSDWKPPLPAQPGEIAVCIQALVEGGSCGVWTRCTPRSAPLRSLVARWAEHQGVPAEVVGCEMVATEVRLDLATTPDELGWGAFELMHIRAIPLNAAFAEAPSTPTRKSRALSLAAQATPPSEAKAAPSSQAVPSKGTIAPSQVVPAKAKAKASSSSQATPAKRKAAEEKGASKKPRAALAALAGHHDSMPMGDDKISFVLENPKRQGCHAYERYEKYKTAKTPKEAMSQGANSGDLKYDWARGFLRRA